jgi:DNA-binding NtrC family response regulator
VSNPDVIIIDLLGMEDEKEAIFDELRTNFKELPFVCLKAPGDDITPETVEGIESYRILKLPAGNERITEVVCELLGARYDRESGTVVDTAYTRKCVMAIDDNSIQLRMLNEMLKDEYDVMLANSAVKALTMLGKRVPDIILLDYDMPMCDGRY